jgi:hypothetical protein
MTNIELLKPTQTKGDLINKSQHTLGGMQELEALLEEIRDAMRGVNRAELEQIQKLPSEKTPLGLLDIEDTKGRHLARCHQLASEIKAIVL